MTDLTFDILRAAVTLAKNEQIKTAEILKSRLKDFYPNSKEPNPLKGMGIRFSAECLALPG